MAQSSKKAAKAVSLEVSFNYQRQAGPGSNQYAVWIENAKGDFATLKARLDYMQGLLEKAMYFQEVEN